MVGADGIEPSTSSVSRKRSTTEPRAYSQAKPEGYQRDGRVSTIRLSAREALGIDSRPERERGTHSPHHRRLAVEPGPLTDAIDGLDPRAVGTHEIGEAVGLELVGRPVEPLVVERIEMKAADDGVDRGGAHDLPRIFDRVDDPGVAA